MQYLFLEPKKLVNLPIGDDRTLYEWYFYRCCHNIEEAMSYVIKNGGNCLRVTVGDNGLVPLDIVDYVVESLKNERYLVERVVNSDDLLIWFPKE